VPYSSSAAEHGGHVLLGLADVLAHEVAGLAHDQRPRDGLGDVLGERGLAGAGRAVEAQRAVATRLQRLDDARDLEAGLDVEHVEVVGGHGAALAATGVGGAQREVGIAQLAFDQRLDRGVVGLGQARETHRGADLRGRQALAPGQLGGEGLGHRHAL